MAVQMEHQVLGTLSELRMHRISKWVRACVGEETVVDSRAPVLVWEPRRVVPSYAVPRADLHGELVAAPADEATERPVRIDEGGPPVLDPRTPFTVHGSPGASLTIRTGTTELVGAAFAPEDPDLADHVVLDWDAFTQWYEEDEPVTGHPHDPYGRIDCLRSSRHVVVSLDGEVLADSHRPTLLFETHLPTRYYLPREDVRMDLLEPSDQRTVCAYKGSASYWSARIGDQQVPDIAWSYEEPLHDAVPVDGLVSFYSERTDLQVDGVVLPRPVTPWS